VGKKNLGVGEKAASIRLLIAAHLRLEAANQCDFGTLETKQEV
jgi:hypothetical protein